MAGKDFPHDGADERLDGTADASRRAEASEFESGLDYGAFIDDDEPDAAPTQPTQSTDEIPEPSGSHQATAPVGSDALDGAGDDTQATEAIDRAALDGDAGTQSTQSIDRAELDAWAAGDAATAEERAAAQDRPAARARGERAGTESASVTATASPDQDTAEGPATLWDAGSSEAGARSEAGSGAAAGAGAAGQAGATAARAGSGPEDYRGFATGGPAADAEDRRRDLRDAEARALARDEALEGPSAGPKVMQVLLALFFPIVVLIAAVRAVASPVFLWIEYHRPGFPADELGFTTEDRLTYGSAGMDYLFNAAPARYLSDLQHQGNQLFTESEVSHMADVKLVMLITLAVGAVLALLCVVFMVALARTAKGGIRRALFAGSLWMLVVLIAVAVLAVLGWETFFAGFHSLFFADGTWTFQATDALIRLYPNQFWMDAGIGIAGLVLLTLIVTLVCTWPTRRRRQDSRLAQADLIRRRNDWYDARDA
ncbi:TIGR01906 family membrane protein [Citricoccus sp. I39-566]|uniref:TIGR01906 family membrane protein n=1 Tax=Citricoccus sp. I39-566 TaxID=3073268 RepID=UPI00286B3EE9|nr:TIGR01906 family membrane protein [Citricoccus sp. I39-566]WMY79627.1 TIGR01906 family membrane protein [Citricoccus sp. I39-566]